MTYPYLTLPDGTEIVHTQEVEKDGKKRVYVYFERPTEQGFDEARCYLPDGKWFHRIGFSDCEMAFFARLLEKNQEQILLAAKSRTQPDQTDAGGTSASRVGETPVRIIAGFSGIGKSRYCENNPNAVDFAIMPYKYVNFQEVASAEGNESIKAHADLILRENWQNFFYEALLNAYRQSPDKLFVIPSESSVLAWLTEDRIPFLLVYPEVELKEEYRQRYLSRGNSPEFLRIFIGYWDAWMASVRRSGGVHLELKQGEYLSDILPLDWSGTR